VIGARLNQQLAAAKNREPMQVGNSVGRAPLPTPWKTTEIRDLRAAIECPSGQLFASRPADLVRKLRKSGKIERIAHVAPLDTVNHAPYDRRLTEPADSMKRDREGEEMDGRRAFRMGSARLGQSFPN
jgi:hypothetical protein